LLSILKNEELFQFRMHGAGILLAQ
jgi:hypothetical protein